MNKLYDRIDWHNNTTPAINETNLNKMSKAVDDIDDRVVEIAGTVMETVPEILDLYEDVEGLADHPPIIGNNGNWWTWDTETDEYVDSGIDAGVSVTIGTTTTLSPGSDATVTNSGTATDPILNFGIPKGAKGDTGSTGATPNITATATVDANVGTPSVNVTKSGTAENPSLAFAFSNIKGAKGDTGATGQTGPAGQGVPTGGTTGQVLAKASGTDYDTEWVNASGGSGGHTIINDAGTSMTQRAGLQFEGMGVTDDSTNDKTVVTLPTPDYVDEQYSSSITYSKGMTCISGNKRYRYINSTASSGHQPPDATYWEVLSVTDQLNYNYKYTATGNNALNINVSGYNEISAILVRTHTGAVGQAGDIVGEITVKEAAANLMGTIMMTPVATFKSNGSKYKSIGYVSVQIGISNDKISSAYIQSFLNDSLASDITTYVLYLYGVSTNGTITYLATITRNANTFDY